MPGFNLVRAEDKTPVGKLPYTLGNEMRVLRFLDPNPNKHPSGELVLFNPRDRRLYRAAPPAVGLMLEPKNV